MLCTLGLGIVNMKGILVSTYEVCERLSVMHSLPYRLKFVAKFSREPLSGIPEQKTCPTRNEKLQIWVYQSSDQNTPPPPPKYVKFDLDFRFRLTKVQTRNVTFRSQQIWLYLNSDLKFSNPTLLHPYPPNSHPLPPPPHPP